MTHTHTIRVADSDAQPLADDLNRPRDADTDPGLATDDLQAVDADTMIPLQQQGNGRTTDRQFTLPGDFLEGLVDRLRAICEGYDTDVASYHPSDEAADYGSPSGHRADLGMERIPQEDL